MSDTSIPAEYANMSDREIEELAKKPNTQVITNTPLGTYECISVEELNAAKDEFRALYLKLRDEEPSWSEHETREYMYENEEAFACFYDSATFTAEILTSDIFDQKTWAQLVDLQGKTLAEEIEVGDFIGKMIQSHRFDGEAISNFNKIVDTEYNGSVDLFMQDQMKKSTSSKAYTEKFYAKRVSQASPQTIALVEAATLASASSF